MKVIKETVIKKEVQHPIKENVAAPFLTVLYKYFAKYFVKKIQEDKGEDKDYMMQQLTNGAGAEDYRIKLVGDYVFDLGGLYERLDMYFIDNLNDVFETIGLDFMIDDQEISKYIYQSLMKSIKHVG